MGRQNSQKTVKNGKNGKQQSKTVNMVKIVCFFKSQNRSPTVKNGQIQPKTDQNGKKWSQMVKND